MKANWKTYYRWSLVLVSGAVLLQTGGCMMEQLLPSVISLALSTLLSLLLGVPI